MTDIPLDDAAPQGAGLLSALAEAEFTRVATPSGRGALSAARPLTDAKNAIAALQVNFASLQAGFVGLQAQVAAIQANARSIFALLAPAPAVTEVTLAQDQPWANSGWPCGVVAGGTTVVITGANFAGVTGVRFTSTATGTSLAALSFTVESATQITAVTPASPDGGPAVVDVTILSLTGVPSATHPDARFAYIFGKAVVTSVSPPGGLLTGQAGIVVTGRGFMAATSCRFGTVQSDFVIASNTRIIAALGDLTGQDGFPGIVNVRVTTPTGTSAINSDAQYAVGMVPVPTVTSVEPNTGSMEGGYPVTITGTNLLMNAVGEDDRYPYAVQFGTQLLVVNGNTVAPFYPLTNETFTVYAPPGDAGVVDVTVANPGSQTIQHGPPDVWSDVTEAAQFTYTP